MRIYLLVFLGGVAGLNWETLWLHHSALALGISARATAITLTATMLGMGAGSFVMGRRAQSWLRKIEPETAYAGLEFVIGAAGLALGAGFSFLSGLDTVVFRADVGDTVASLIHAAGILLLLGVPAFCMGATIPVMAAIAERRKLSIGGLYGANIFGACLGLLLTSFVLVPSLGVELVTAVTSFINILAALLFFLLGRNKDRVANIASTLESMARRVPVGAVVVAFSTGFVTFLLEVAWFRAFRAALQATTESFALMLSAVLLSLAIGAQLARWLRRRPSIHLATVLTVAAAGVLLVTPAVEKLDLWIMTFQVRDYTSYIFTRASVSAALLCPPMVAIGVCLPWILETVEDPRSVSIVYAFNTIGGVVGALLAGWVLLPTIGFARTAMFASVVLVVASFFVIERRFDRIFAVTLPAVALAVALFFGAGADRLRVRGSGVYAAQARVLDVREGPDSTVSVYEDDKAVRWLVIDGFVASGTGKGGHYMVWMGRLPMLLHPDPKNALVICFGVGRTAHAVRSERPERLDLVDLNASVFAMAHHFELNHGVLDDPVVHPVVMDGRAWLRRTEREYDVITLEPMPPTFAGVNALYSREFYELSRARLSPNGVVAQWLPFHLVSRLEGASITRTFMEVFEEVILWLDPVNETGILIGRRGDATRPLDWYGLARTGIDRNLTDEQIKLGSSFFSRETLERYAAGGIVITDDNQLLSYGSGRMPWLLGNQKAANLQTLKHLSDR